MVCDQVCNDQVGRRAANMLEPSCYWFWNVDYKCLMQEHGHAELNRQESVQGGEQDGDRFDDCRDSEAQFVAALTHDHGQEG